MPRDRSTRDYLILSARLTALAPHHIISPVHPIALVGWTIAQRRAANGEYRVQRPKKKWFIGRHLMIKKQYAEKLLNGEKKATIRLGVVKVKHDELIVHSGGKPIAKIKVKNIKIKKIGELSDEDARLDGFSNKEELLAELRKVYGHLKDEDIVSIIEFELIQKFEGASEDPYKGIEPGDLARIALRYIPQEFDEKEHRILVDLTKTNSIRATTINLFNNINKRYIVRRVLRKALRLLRAKGIL